jgi:hypothetical protein
MSELDEPFGWLIRIGSLLLLDVTFISWKRNLKDGQHDNSCPKPMLILPELTLAAE